MGSSNSRRSKRPALTEEGRENQIVSMAMDLAEEQIANGTASSQVMTHYLKLGSSTAKLERDKLRSENALLKAKCEDLASAKRVEELYRDALSAMRAYSGQEEEPSDAYDEDVY